MKEVPDYGSHREVPSNIDLAELSQLIESLDSAKIEEAKAFAEYTEKRGVVDALELFAIPELMTALHTKKHETRSGRSVMLSEKERG